MTMMTYRNPAEERRTQDERLFSDFSEDNRMPMHRDWSSIGNRSSTWMPAIEVDESDQELVVSASLPGMKPENINVEMIGHTLVVSGETRRESQVNDKHYHRSEFQYGQFMRRIPLPEYVTGDQCEATFNNGVLEVHIPKSGTSQARKIEVKTGQ